MPENEYNNTRAITASLIKLQLEQKSTYTVKGEEICSRQILNIRNFDKIQIKGNAMFFVWWKTKIEQHTPRKGCINMVIDASNKRQRILFK